jgi:hypothetical protein
VWVRLEASPGRPVEGASLTAHERHLEDSSRPSAAASDVHLARRPQMNRFWGLLERSRPR